LSRSGAGKLGNPCARLRELCSRARRVIPRITDSRKPWVRRAVVTMLGSRKASAKYSGAFAPVRANGDEVQLTSVTP
jgi:hypothetical protein